MSANAPEDGHRIPLPAIPRRRESAVRPKGNSVMTGSRRHPNVGDPQNVFDEILARRLSRRSMLKGSLGLAAMSLFGGCQSLRDAQDTGPRLGFTSIPPSKADAVIVAPEYEWHVVNAWGDPIMPGAPDFKPDASQSRGGAGDAGGDVSRRHALFSAAEGVGLLRPRAHRDQLRVHRRQPPDAGRHGDVDGGEGAEIEERARPGRLRGAVRRQGAGAPSRTRPTADASPPTRRSRSRARPPATPGCAPPPIRKAAPCSARSRTARTATPHGARTSPARRTSPPIS